MVFAPSVLGDLSLTQCAGSSPEAQGFGAVRGAGKAISGTEHGNSKGGNRSRRQPPSQVTSGWFVRDLEQELERQLAEAYIANNARNLELLKEFEHVDREAWLRLP